MAIATLKAVTLMRLTLSTNPFSAIWSITRKNWQIHQRTVLSYCKPTAVRYLWKHIHCGGELRVFKTAVYDFFNSHIVIFLAVFLRVVATLE